MMENMTRPITKDKPPVTHPLSLMHKLQFYVKVKANFCRA